FILNDGIIFSLLAKIFYKLHYISQKWVRILIIFIKKKNFINPLIKGKNAILFKLLEIVILLFFINLLY
mgnify:CR=1